MINVSSNLRGRSVLVTGASGFIGSHLNRRLVAAGADVHAVSRSDQPDSDNLRWWQADLADFSRVSEVVETVKPELIYHLASHVSGSRGLPAVLPTLHANLVSTVNLMTVAVEAGCPRIVLAGSLEESNGDDAVPSSPYAAAKSAASAYARMFHSLYGLQTVTLRLAMVYGPDQPDESKLIPYVIRSLLSGATPRLSSGRREVDWVYVEDVVDAMIASAADNDQGFLNIEIGSGVSTSIGEVASRLCDLVDPSIRPILGAVADRPCERSWTADRSQAFRALGWRPRTSLDDGLRQTVEWHQHAREFATADC
jgi:nucleoside-diphosphate-sugar epimerase